MQLFQHHMLKRLSFSIECLLCLSKKELDTFIWVYFSTPLSLSLVSVCQSLCPSHSQIIVDYYRSLKTGSYGAFNCSLCFQIILAILCPLIFLINFRFGLRDQFLEGFFFTGFNFFYVSMSIQVIDLSHLGEFLLRNWCFLKNRFISSKCLYLCVWSCLQVSRSSLLIAAGLVGLYHYFIPNTGSLCFPTFFFSSPVAAGLSTALIFQRTIIFWFH